MRHAQPLQCIPLGAVYVFDAPLDDEHRELARRLGLCARVYGRRVFLCRPRCPSVDGATTEADVNRARGGALVTQQGLSAGLRARLARWWR